VSAYLRLATNNRSSFVVHPQSAARRAGKSSDRHSSIT